MLRVMTKRSERQALQDWMTPPPYVLNKELRLRRTEDKLFSKWPGPAVGSGRLTFPEETMLFKQLHFCGFRLSRLYQSAHHVPLIRVKREYSRWLHRYHQLRTRLTEGNLGLVYDMFGRSKFDQFDREELTSEGMMALLRAVDTFDPWRGFRFSTYACNAIIRAFSRAALKEYNRRSRIAGPWDPEFETGDHQAIRREEDRALFAERLNRIMDLELTVLSEVEKSVLSHRFNTEPGQSRITLERLGRQMHVSKERVRQIQLSAIAKLRRAMAADEVLQPKIRSLNGDRFRETRARSRPPPRPSVRGGDGLGLERRMAPELALCVS